MEFSITSFLRKNWFKLFCIGLLVYIFFQKDLSFQINMKVPESTQTPSPTVQAPREQMTDAALHSSVTSSKLFDRLDLSGFGSSINPSEALDQLSYEQKLAYLKRFARVAISERKKYGLPSSIILANALLQSSGGISEVTRSTNNHFGLLATEDWNENSQRFEGFKYRAYDNAWSSFRDHSQYLINLDYNQSLPAQTDYKTWATLLEKQGVYQISDLDDQLLNLIEAFQLYELDTK